jgi:(heptosyl)LPS beta-1,4-glucosyltransferase
MRLTSPPIARKPAPKISAVIKAKNEARQIEACIKSLAGLADEIIVMDDESTDNTAALAAQLGATVIPAQRGDRCIDTLDVIGFHAATGEWLLRIDADERMVPTLAAKLKEMALAGDCDAVRYPRKNIMFGDWAKHGGWFRSHMTFFHKSVWDGVSPARPHTPVGVSGRMLFLPEKEEFATIHYDYAEVHDFVQRSLWKYALTDAKERHLVGQRFSTLALLLRPLRCFLGRYFIRQGFRDGRRGLILAGLGAGYEFCIQANLWDLGRLESAKSTSPGLKLLIVEPEASGHHMRYVQSLVARAQARGHAVRLATTTEALRHTAFREFRDDLRKRGATLDTVAIRSPKPPFVERFSRIDMVHRQWLGWLSFRACCRSLSRAGWRPDFVLFPYLNDIDLMIALVGSPFPGTPWGGIAMRESFHRSQVNPSTPDPSLRRVRRWFFDALRQAPGLAVLVTIDETLSEFVRLDAASGVRPAFVPEPAELQFTATPADARRELGIPESGEYVLLYGHVHMSKGVAELMRAVAAIQTQRQLSVLVVGHLTAEVRRFLATEGQALRDLGRLFVHDQFASLRQEALAFSAADVVWVGYSRHYGPSSVLGKAATARRPVVGCREGVIGWTIARYGIGLAVDVRDTAAVANALLQTLQSSSRAALCINVERYAQQRQGIDFGQSVIDLVETAVDRKQPAPAVENRAEPYTV